MGKPALVVLAAGIGSRYGGLKQIEPIGPGGETIIDYSVYDAMRSGFEKLVFVICKNIEEDFREIIGRRFEGKMDVAYVFQELDRVPAGFAFPAERNKPWGTGHAVLVAEEAVSEPFAVINGDDFYGPCSFRILGEYLCGPRKSPGGVEELAMVGFTLRQTLSEHGHVSRGVCWLDGDGYLERIVEYTRLVRDGAGAKFTDDSGVTHNLSGDEVVSMNLWAFTPAIFRALREGFERFIQERGSDLKAEYFLPSAVDALIERGKVRVKVLRTPDAWCGVTYRSDKLFVDRSIRRLIAQGVYPEKLWA